MQIIPFGEDFQIFYIESSILSCHFFYIYPCLNKAAILCKSIKKVEVRN